MNEDITEFCRQFPDEELHNLYVIFIRYYTDEMQADDKSELCMGRDSHLQNLAEKPEGRTSLQRLGLEGKIMDHKELSYEKVDWIHLAHGR
jgi:hypothetical protein